MGVSNDRESPKTMMKTTTLINVFYPKIIQAKEHDRRSREVKLSLKDTSMCVKSRVNLHFCCLFIGYPKMYRFCIFV